MRNTITALILVITVLFFLGCKEQTRGSEGVVSEQIRLNQIGYYPIFIKKAVVVGVVEATEFELIEAKSGKNVFSADLSEARKWELSGEEVRIADFTDFNEEGTYQLAIAGIGQSYPFEIGKHILQAPFLGSVKGLYYQRASMALDEKFAGKWHRAAGHPDDSVSFHPSSGRTDGFLVSPKGWYDAGDYGKYVLNASFPLGQFYTLYEEYPEAIIDGDLNIPESGNGRSDYLDELKYEMDWVLTMQDEDGGMFHKLTTKGFEGMVMPDKAVSTRYVIGKGTGSTLDFAAMAAQAYRVFQTSDQDYANTCLVASRKAYQWAKDNPDVAFKNPEDISTGEYGDDDFSDEFFWAASELFVSTGDQQYLDHLKEEQLDFEMKPGDGWRRYMRFLGMFSLLRNPENVPDELLQKIRSGILASADDLVSKALEQEYFQPIDDFQWGSNSDVLNAAMIMAHAYRINPDKKYLFGAQQAVDYILGNNAVGYSFLSGFGDKTPMFLHHRPSAADGIEESVPGLLSGGPNSRLQDASNGVVYPENVAPMKAWVDQEPSYASNEICLNWNAPLTYVLGFLEQESN
ncbi:cellulase [Flavobacteriaceae bacterium R33]|uniref:Endoglucanase n=2 Tax=Poritiphilus flavus TaxID=2697053 RepID=A0A6L9EC56_9FLAO|nr:cellulase [Poritiphilus flavus]